MTIGESELLHPRPPEPIVRAPRAAAKVTGQGAVDEAWSLLVQQALGLGAPRTAEVKREEPPPEPATPGTNGSTVTLGVAGGRSVSLPTSPKDQDGIYRGLLWVAWAVEECSRAFTRISSRLGNLERRIDVLETERKQPPSPVVFDVESVEAPPAEVPPKEDEELARLEARLEEATSSTRRRVDGLEERLRQLDFVPLKVSNLQRSVDQLAVAGRKASVAETERAGPGPAGERELAELRHELALAQRRLAELDARMSEASMAAAAEAAVRRHAELLAPPAPAAVDVEGVYRELDAVAEFVAARAESTAESLERIGPLEVAVLELRRDLGRAIAEFGAHAGRDAELRVTELEARLRRLEASGEKLDRLYSALETLARVNGS